MKTSTLVLDLHKAALRTRTGTGLVTLVAIISLTVSSTIAYLVAGGTWMFYQRSLRPQDFHVVQETLANGPDDPIMSTWVIMALFACAFLVPTIVSLTAQAAVLGASGREKRLATLRLIGLSSGDITRMTMLETAAQAAIGIVLGGFFSVLLAPIFSNMKFQDVYISASELILPWWGYLTVAVVVFVLAITASVVGMQRVRVEPLGVSRKEMPPALKYRSAILFVVFTVFTLIMVDRTSMSSGIAAMAIVAAVVSINVMLINWVAPFLLQVFYRMVSIMPGTSHFVASQRIAADAKTTWRRSASMAFFGVIAGYLVISPVGADGLTAMMSEEPGVLMMFRDLATGGVLTLVFGFVLSAMSVFLGLASQIFEQAHLTRSLHLMGVSRSFYFRTQVFETLGPIIIVSLIGFTFGVMLGSVMLSSGIADVNFPMRLSMAGSILGIGWLFPLAAIAAVEPLRTRTLNVGRDND
ncbi:FtsX-like permease family protein [Corynebacterium stationis]|uniref:ABC transporter permease n=1 Tax=Corynebacterium stationis TaxID=1705 RepID=A0AB36CKD0_9CORY|nr:FtsX-like permease family protein [Corynebacterium stationis]NME89174.1 ABC transporter permease [Corynebacterium stationis]